jgi:poly(ADP-ribose) glycohydrolase ARH3
MRWTDDTRMTLDVAESLVKRGTVDPDDLAYRFAASYRWSRGYGPAMSKVLKRVAKGDHWQQANRSVYRDGSFGNGAAMRAPVIGLFYANRHLELDDAARRSAIVTHAHELGVAGAVLIARATAAAARGETSSEILRSASERTEPEPLTSRVAIAQRWLQSGDEVPWNDVVRRLGNGIAAHESCVTAVYLALRFREAGFIEMQQAVAAMGGDADTIGAMAGAIWGATNGIPIGPPGLLEKLEQCERLTTVAAALYERAVRLPPGGALVVRA